MVSANKLVCICQICTCGRHHCIHRPQTGAKPTGPCHFTEYKDTYRRFSNFEPTKPIKPDCTYKPSKQPFDGSTSYKQVYRAHALGPRSKREQTKYVKPEGQFNGTSSYQHDYFEKTPEKVISAKPSYQPTASKPFSGTTVNQQTYKPWALPSTKAVYPPKAAIRLPTGKFDHTTTFQDDFPGYAGGTGRETIKPPEPALLVGVGKIENETTTRADYTKKNARPEKSAKPPQAVVNHKGPFVHRTTTQQAYGWPKSYVPVESCRPEHAVSMSTAPLESDTTHNTTYKAWQVQRSPSHKQDTKWAAPKEAFDHRSTFQHDYINKSCERAKSARPSYERVAPGQFDGSTTHKEAFKAWQSPQRKSMKPSFAYKGPGSKFDGKTTFQSDFTGHSSARPDLCIPKEGGVSFSGPQQFSTMYKDTYHGKRPPSCPAKFLELRQNEPSKNGFVYQLDMNGHQLFKSPGEKESVEVVDI